MTELLPAHIKVTEIEGLLNIIREYGGPIRMSALASYTKEGVDRLLEVLRAARVLGLINVKSGVVSVTGVGKELNLYDFQNDVRDHVAAVEPFKTSVRLLKKGNGMTTSQLLLALLKANILAQYSSYDIENIKWLLTHWGIRIGLFAYEARNDRWKLKKH